MPTRTSYKQGTPNWVDIQTTDVAGAKAFYGALLGWTFADMEMPGAEGVYSMAMLPGGPVAAIAEQTPPARVAGAPPMWNTYLAVDDVDAATKSAEAAGATVVMEPMDITDAGRMSFIFDPTGAAVAFWQARTHIGATVVNEPGALVWNELLTSDVAAATAFYDKALGLKSDTIDMGGSPYTMWTVDGATVGGVQAPFMPDAPNHWHVYFGVANAADAVAKAKNLGAEIVVEPMTIPVGTMAVLRDPQGGYFSVFESSGPTS